jgi:putative DNA primase/helicase
MNEKIDIKLIAQTALGQTEPLVQNWLPNGKREGVYWISLNPTRVDNKTGSFKVNINTGQWGDFATEDKGGDLVSLYAYLNNVSQTEAAKAVASSIGMTVVDLLPRMKQKIPIVPVPPDAPECKFKIPKYGDPTGMWPYHDADGNLLFYRVRFDFENKDGEQDKVVMPVTYCDIGNGKCAWRSKDIPGLKPLYNLPQILSKPDVDIIVVEGEKAADAAQILFHGMIVTTWSGGGNAYKNTDWSYLKGRKVFLWPDADGPGYATIIGLTAYLQEKFKS